MADYHGEDAIYVVSVGDNGLPIVGHAYLYVQDSEGNWYKTEFAGETKRDATVKIIDKDETQIQAELSRDGVYFVYIAGDFSDSYDLALKHDGTHYGGYHFTSNNCLHYVKALLRAGSPKNLMYEAAIYSLDICPRTFYWSLKEVEALHAWLQRQRMNSSNRTAIGGTGGGMRCAYTCWQ